MISIVSDCRWAGNAAKACKEDRGIDTGGFRESDGVVVDEGPGVAGGDSETLCGKVEGADVAAFAAETLSEDSAIPEQKS